jgi:hypothetical protein
MATDSYWSGNAYTSSNAAVQFARLGHPGRYTEVFTHGQAKIQTDFTGSNYGYGAIMIGSGSGAAFGANDAVHLSGGGSILFKDIKNSTAFRSDIIELSVIKVVTTAGAPTIYILKRQQ